MSSLMKRLGIGGSVAAIAAAGVLTGSPAAAAPGDWVNVSAIPAGSRYPEISTGASPAIVVFGNDVQVAWEQRDGTTSSGVYTAIMDKTGAITAPSRAVVSAWKTMGSYPQLLSYQGQRAVSFGGTTPGRGQGQSLATSPDGLSWTLNPGSLSATNSADVSWGGNTVNSPGETLIWAGAINGGDFRWHVGLSPTDPADTPDQTYATGSSGTSGVNAVLDPSTGITYGAYYLNTRPFERAGTFVGPIHPTFNGFTQVPGSSTIDSLGNPQQTSAGDIVPLAARAQGGVYVGYIDLGDDNSLKIREVNSGTVLSVPGSSNASNASLSAAPNGRLWVTFEKSDQMYTAQTDPGAKAFGASVLWGTPGGGSSTYGARIAGDDRGAYIATNTYAAQEQNIWATAVIPNLTIEVVGKARRGGTVKLRILDGGAPVRNAKVTVGGKALKSKKGGLVAFKAPGASSVKVTAKGSGYRDGTATVTLAR